MALIVGAVVARRLTGPLARLRRVSSRLAHGELDERSPRFGVVEVDELGQQFNVMADRLSESVRMLEADRDRLREFVADVSHELRTPIAALRTFTELQRDGQVDEAQRREFLDRSTEQINRLEWMSTNLLDLSRIDAGIFPLDMRWGDLRDPVRAVVEAHAELAEGRGISLVSEVPTSPVMLRFDRERIVQLLNNLVGNALKFTQARRRDRGRAGRRRPMAAAWRCATPDRASRRPSCRSCSTASSAARTWETPAPRAAAWGWPSLARSWRCTAGASRPPARSGRAPSSRSICPDPEAVPAAEGS